MKSPWIFVAAISGALAVILGAMGGHSIKPYTQAANLHDKAIFYHFAHVYALFVVGFLAAKMQEHSKLLMLSGSLFTVGTVLFSGSLYMFSLTGTFIGGFITPAGGVCLIAGWVLLALAGFKAWKSN